MRLRSIAVTLLSVTGLLAAEPAWGPPTGSVSPAFSLPNQDGLKSTLSSLLRENGAYVVFFRSCDW